LILPGILILAACGGDSEEVKDSASPAAVATTAATTAATEAATQVAQAATQAATEVAQAATAVATPEGDISEYTVVEGDNLTTIAARYGLTVDQLRSLNPEVSGDVLWVGQILKVAGELKQLDEATATATATAAADATQEPTAAATATNTGMTMGSNESKAGLPPFVPWGNNASAGVTVTASVNGVICTTAVADASGQWFFRLEDGCGNEGATVTFTTSDGRSATSTYKMGEGAMVLFSN